MIWKTKRDRPKRNDFVKRRAHAPERLEGRRLLAADPIHVGVVYFETDYLESDQDVGSDSRGDRFILSFTGGAPDTELSELRIRTDKDGDGISVGDPIFDTQQGGRGKAGAHAFELLALHTGDGHEVNVTAEVDDGGQELVLKLSNFRAGDRLEFTIDVDEVLRNAVDLEVFNDRLDVITSGQEFQDSILEATFTAPHYEVSNADAIFLNDYGDPAADTGLDLPPDEGSPQSRPNRSAAAVADTVQQPKPVEISGQVWLDNDQDRIREPGEPGISGVQISLWKFDEDSNRYVDTGLDATSDTNGRYRFAKSLGIAPGTYRVVESQPAGLFSVGAVVGSVAGVSTGTIDSVDSLSGIALPLGDTAAVNYDFAEAEPTRISGVVFQDDNDNGQRDAGEPGLAGVSIKLIPIETTAPQSGLMTTTTSDGSYQFIGLSPGHYELVELVQPAHLADGLDTAGTVNGVTVGMAVNPGDRIKQIELSGGDVGLDYNFGEVPLSSVTGLVYMPLPGEDCDGSFDSDHDVLLPGVQVEIQDHFGTTVATTTTDANGSYRFASLRPGNYRIIQYTPAGLIDGSAHVGNVSGVTVGNAIDGGLIQDIVLAGNSQGVAYNFCEAAPATISGYVYQDDSRDGVRDSDEQGIRNVQVQLIDQQGNVVSTQSTDRLGHYKFAGVLPGNYSIVESQPSGYLDGIDRVGTIRGQRIGQLDASGDRIANINLGQGDQGVEYNFGELLPASLSGRIHLDLDGDCLLDANEPTLSGVTLQLFDDAGNLVATTTTDIDGRYEFQGLPPGTYSVIEQQPTGLLEGVASPGTAGGIAEGPNRIVNVTLGSGQDAEGYDFCEVPAARIAGTVFFDSDGDCLHDPNERGLRGVVIELRDAGGAVVAQTTTDQTGQYAFDGLAAGVYQVFEVQPSTDIDGQQIFDGQEIPGTGVGRVLGDDLLGVELLTGEMLVDYNFCELLPASIAGRVWHESEPDQVFQPGDVPIPGVLVELLDDAGNQLRSTRTDAVGNYRFTSIRPGVYSVREVQPDGYFHGGQLVGSSGGQIAGDDLVVNVELHSGIQATEYNFPEIPPATISGIVFQDGPQIVSSDAIQPHDLRDFRDGQFTPDDQPIPGVTIELRDINGAPIAAATAMAGIYADGPIRAVTDATGYYEFNGLRPGTYHIYQVHPVGYVDSLDTPGSAGGSAINAADPLSDATAEMLDRLSADSDTDPRSDAIVNVAVAGGDWSRQNNFSEIVVVEPEPQLPTPLPPLPPPSLPPVIAPNPELPTFAGLVTAASLTVTPALAPLPIRLATFAAPEQWQPPLQLRGNQVWDVSWHLSVINAGYPRGEVRSTGPFRAAAVRSSQSSWSAQDRNLGFWSIMRAAGPRNEASGDEGSLEMTLGSPGAVPLTGDFDGDGFDEIAIFVDGQWFVDLNGNGVWDAGDLWIVLGTKADHPVVGDWDGDGKDDIGIFGRRWQHDVEWIRRDPGLPDPENLRRRIVDSRRVATRIAPENEQPKRLLQRGREGQLRADAVDHVFGYGGHVDTPITGDWNGDGIDQIAVFQGGHWKLDRDGDGRWTERDIHTQFGRPGDLPVVGDFNGDEIDEIGVVRGDLWIIDSDGDRRITGNDLQFEVPRPSADAEPVVGDFDGDGKSEPGYYDQAG